ncbi:GHKL domain-containing protein [[Clostridium] innocuum]|nr:GHKL domain-containing protein [[Clostridium] innocuum]
MNDLTGYNEIIYAFLTYMFIYRITKCQIKFSTTRKIMFLILCIFVLIIDIILFTWVPMKTEYGIYQHLPGILEYIFLMIFLIGMAGKEWTKMLYYYVFGYTIVLGIDLCISVSRIWINWLDYEYMYLILKLLLLGISDIVFRNLFHKTFNHKNKDWHVFSLLAIIACFYVYFILELLPEMDFTDGVSIDYLSIYLILFLISIYMIFYEYLVVLGKRNQSLDEAEYQLDNQKQQKQLLEELKKANQENRKLRHDLKHHFHSLEYMMNTDPEKAKSYLQELSEHVEAVKVLTTKNPVLDYIVNSKMAICRTKGIAFTYEVQDNLKQMQDFDLISLLSNALDNAIEAQEYVDNKFISCKILDGKTATKIFIENACDTARLQKSNDTFQTIKKEKGQHGIGLGRIKTIAESYHGYMKIKLQDSFLLEISIAKTKTV